MFSPIEEQTWGVLRGFGQAPLYPQYPVDKFFVDFGNPFKKIAIECDGKEWHLDKKKDLKRDKRLSKLGWVVYRIDGSDCFRIVKDYSELGYKNEDETIDILSRFYESTIEGLVKAIAIFYFGHKTYNRFVNEYELAADCLINRVSINKEKCQKLCYQIIEDNITNIPMDLRVQTLWV